MKHCKSTNNTCRPPSRSLSKQGCQCRRSAGLEHLSWRSSSFQRTWKQDSKLRLSLRSDSPVLSHTCGARHIIVVSSSKTYIRLHPHNVFQWQRPYNGAFPEEHQHVYLWSSTSCTLTNTSWDRPFSYCWFLCPTFATRELCYFEIQTSCQSFCPPTTSIAKSQDISSARLGISLSSHQPLGHS